MSSYSMLSYNHSYGIAGQSVERPESFVSKFSESELQQYNNEHHTSDGSRKISVYIDHKSMVNSLNAIKSGLRLLGCLRYMTSADSGFPLQKRLLETLVPLTFLKTMIYLRLLVNLSRYTWFYDDGPEGCHRFS